MADAFARTSGLVAVVSVHQGPGLTNAITGITEAAKSRTPLLVLAADVAAAAVRSNFRIDADSLVAATGAVPERVHSAATAVDDVIRAWRTARNGRRTVVLSVPMDVQEQSAELRVVEPLARPVPIRSGKYATKQLATLLNAAERPVFLAGRGAIPYRKVLRDLALRTGALLATSAVAKGLFDGDPFDLGISGGFATPLAAELITGADLLVAWGCSLTDWTTRHGALLGDGTTIVQVDDTEAALGVNAAVSSGGDRGRGGDRAGPASPGGVAESRVPLPDAGDPAADRRGGSLGRRCRSTTSRRSDTIDPRLLSRELDRRLPRERVLAVDSGNFMGYPAAYLSVPDPAGFCFTQGFQAVGPGAGDRHRRRPGQSRPAAGARHRRRRIPDGDRRAGDRGPARARPADRRLQRPRVRGRDPPLRSRRRPGHRDLPGHRSRGDRAGLRCRRDHRPRRRAISTTWPAGSTARATGRCSSTPRSATTAAPGGWRRPSADTEGDREPLFGHGGPMRTSRWSPLAGMLALLLVASGCSLIPFGQPRTDPGAAGAVRRFRGRRVRWRRRPAEHPAGPQRTASRC